ncbi:MAG TPA: STAS domain-containing protein [Phycisphaerae bacterium]|nr:STAS domain-containing protein [Phycisphaerae bacterium]HOI55789.1 STAS domain-containing protein [Phycisphaerae bacterium]
MTRVGRAGEPNRLKIAVEDRAPASLVHLEGDVDLNVSPVLRKQLKDLVASRAAMIVVDMSDVPYIDSSGVATLVECLQGVSRYGGKLHLASLRQQTRSVFEISRLDSVFSIFPTVEEALKA